MDSLNEFSPVSLPNTEPLSAYAFLACPRFERSCDTLIEQYSMAYHNINEHLAELAEDDQTHDFTDELIKQLRGRTIAVYYVRWTMQC